MGKENKQPNQYWFVAKKYGYGWGLPLVWQGWVALIGCLVVGMAPIAYLALFYKGDVYCRSIIAKGIETGCNPELAAPTYLLGAFLWLGASILVLVQICVKKGEKISIRWIKNKNSVNISSK